MKKYDRTIRGPLFLEVSGNKGGSYVKIASTTDEGVVVLEVGHDCVKTIDSRVNVVDLARVLTDAYESREFDQAGSAIR